jgi:predicted ATPase
MSRIKIKNFGPIKEGFLENDGWLEVKKVTVFIGNQGSGKSTVAKVISTLTWMEKALSRGDIEKEQLLTEDDFYWRFEYQRIEKYFRDDTLIEYEGEFAHIIVKNKIEDCRINFVEGTHLSILPKIMYVPAERNFLTVVRDAYDVKNIPDTLKTFGEELKKSMLSLNGDLLKLPIGKDKIRYDKSKDKIFLVINDLDLEISDSSSGYQSLVPLYAVTRYLCNEIKKNVGDLILTKLSINQSVRKQGEIDIINDNPLLSETEKRQLIKKIDKKYFPQCLINVVEEPEQNLFPASQQNILNSLLKYNNMYDGNKLIMTTHSPYLINYLTLAVKAEMVKSNLPEDSMEKLAEVFPLNSTIKGEELVIYQMDDITGTFAKLENYRGLPSDENELNNELGDSNEIFAQLQEIEKGWR